MVVFILSLVILIAVIAIAVLCVQNNPLKDSECDADGYHIYYDRKIVRYNKNKKGL